MKDKCQVCGNECYSSIVSVADVTRSNGTPICYNCIDNFIVDHEYDSILESVEGSNKYKGKYYFSKCIILDSDFKSLYAYKYKRPQWKTYTYKSRVWYNRDMEEEADRLVDYLSSPISNTVSTKQIKFISSLITKGTLSKPKIYDEYNVSSLKDLTRQQAKNILDVALNGGTTHA